jgi:hypothetical protein
MASCWKGLVNLWSVTMTNKEFSFSFAFMLQYLSLLFPVTENSRTQAQTTPFTFFNIIENVFIRQQTFRSILIFRELITLTRRESSRENAFSSTVIHIF